MLKMEIAIFVISSNGTLRYGRVGAAVGGRARAGAGRHARLARRARVPVGPGPARLVGLDRAGFPGAGVQ